MQAHTCKRHGSRRVGPGAKRPRCEHGGLQTEANEQLAAASFEHCSIEGDGALLTGSSVRDSSGTRAYSSSASSSSRSMSPVFPTALPRGTRIRQLIGRGNNATVYVAERVTDEDFSHGEENEAAARAEQLQPPPTPPPQKQQQQLQTQLQLNVQDGAPAESRERKDAGCDEADAGSAATNQGKLIAVKCMPSSSRHLQREKECLEHLNKCYDQLEEEARSNTRESLVNGEGCFGQLLKPTCIFPRPFPRLLFARQVGQDAALGLERLGADLFAFTERHVLREEELCVVGMELIRTLAVVHELGTVHRSVKPENFCWNPEVLGGTWDRTTPHQHHDGERRPVEGTSGYMFKIIDFGRGTVITGDSPSTPSSSYEEPYSGWWHSLRGFLGKPLGQKDDLMGVVHTIGYLLDDYIRDQCASSLSSSRSSSHSRACDSSCSSKSTASCSFSSFSSSMEKGPAGGCQTAADSRTKEVIDAQCFEGGMSDATPKRASSPSEQKTSTRKCRSYSSCRHKFADKISDIYEVVERQYRREVDTGRGRQRVGAHKKHHSGCSHDAVERRNTRRAWIVRRIEEEFLPTLLPDRYFPPTMPQWWVEWFAACNAWCEDDSVSTAEMTERMMHTLRQQLLVCGGAVPSMRQSLEELYLLYVKEEQNEAEKEVSEPATITLTEEERDNDAR
ncbi:hypothetical protein DQ04_04531030 [Trypanosoma grayi]|uniref:hypothetical protein n=1 Tax=Trypanosoma grayi TaxID=71804 RepID=UPI0004F43642|nr:hypothetical protein DQ04_04531030 [Trypanosoma grayi]KEG09853.1 hypothetical protein DQ04_04531030 [Trypanosoma grayi]